MHISWTLGVVKLGIKLNRNVYSNRDKYIRRAIACPKGNVMKRMEELQVYHDEMKFYIF
jgi:hypothetical protein